MIDTDMAEQILKGDDTHPDILQALGLEILAELKRLREELDETEYRLEMAEDVLGRSDWFSVYSELIKGEE